MIDRLATLERLAQLRAANMLSEEEYTVEKAKVLSAPPKPGKDGAGKWRMPLFVVAISGFIAFVGFAIANFAKTGTETGLRETGSRRTRSSPAAVASVVPIKPVPLASPSPSPTPCRGMDCAEISPRGWAGIESGMSIAKAQKVSGLRLHSDGHYDDLDNDCRRYVVRGGPKDLTMLVENGVITSLTVSGDRYSTARDIHVGSSESKLRKAYTPLRSEQDVYGGPKDKLYFYDVDGGKHGFNFGVNSGKVTAITFGGSSRGYVEGCL